jgi:hypothetical protein
MGCRRPQHEAEKLRSVEFCDGMGALRHYLRAEGTGLCASGKGMKPAPPPASIGEEVQYHEEHALRSPVVESHSWF